MRSMIRDGTQLVLAPQGKNKPPKVRYGGKIPMAMAENLVTRLQLIVLRGSDANVLRLVAIMNDVFKPSRNNNGHGDSPFPATFIRPPQGGAPC